MKKVVVFVAGSLVLAGSFLVAQARNVSPARHPNLAAAQRLCADAVQKINAAQQANEFDMGGHAQKAKDLLVQASEEIKLAALTSNERGR